MEPNITIGHLIIETTRRCNMTCQHCLRGDAQNLDIDNKLIKKLMDQTQNINNITFTGGEPTLNLGALEFTLQTLKDQKKEIDSFYMVTNAKEYSQKFVDILNEYYIYCINNSYNSTALLKPTDPLPDNKDYEFYGGLAVSHDKYHDPIPYMNYIRYSLLTYYQHDKEQLEDKHILNIGNANKNGIGNVNKPISEIYIEEYDNHYDVDTLYLNAAGDILADCNLSYELQFENNYGNLANENLLDIIKRNV